MSGRYNIIKEFIVKPAAKAVKNVIKGSKGKSNFIKDKAGTIVGVKPGSGNVPKHIGAAGKDLAKRAEIVKINQKVKNIEARDAALGKIKEGKDTIKKMRQTNRLGKPIGSSGRAINKYYPLKPEGKLGHKIKEKKATGGRVGLKRGTGLMQKKSNIQKIKETFSPKKRVNAKKGFPDLSGDGKTTFKDILILWKSYK